MLCPCPSAQKAWEAGGRGIGVFCEEEMLVGPRCKSKFALSGTLEMLNESDEYLESWNAKCVGTPNRGDLR